MPNEIIKIDETTNVLLNLGSIKIDGLDQLKEEINKEYDLANSQVVTAETLKEGKDTRKKLNKKVKDISSARIKLTKLFLEPLNDFQEEMKALEKKGKEASNSKADQIKYFENKKRDEKRDEIQDFINEVSPNYNCDQKDIEIHDKWLNKSTSKKTWQEEVVEQMKTIDEFKQRRQLEEESLRMFGNSIGIADVTPYINCLNHDMNVLDIQKDMQSDIEKQQARLAEKQANQTVVKDKVINNETGEVEDSLITVTVKLTGTKSSLLSLIKYLDNNGISHEMVGD